MVVKRPWSKEEVSAVESNLAVFLKKLEVPQKQHCMACINAQPDILKGRDWKAVKYFVKNKITAIKRSAFQ